ncbi:MAG: AAA family ATPase [Spirochaetes bacterium]|nr:AAA family ATPase [Spirochaetota bacterium]
MRIITVSNHKGGVGNTTTAVNIGAGLAMLEKKVLLIDLDPQAHLTYSLGIQAHELEKTVYELLKGELKFADVLIKKEKLDIIPASLNLSSADVELANTPGRERLLVSALEGVSSYDYIILDCPPSLGLLTLNALTTSKEVFIPIQAEYLALQGMSKLLQLVDIVKDRLNSELEITGIIGTRFDNRKKLNHEVIDKIREYFHEKLFKTLVRENIALAEAPGFGQDIFEYNPRSHGAVDYLNLCREIIEKG